MSADIGPGDVVVCVDARPHSKNHFWPDQMLRLSLLREGVYYRVRDRRAWRGIPDNLYFFDLPDGADGEGWTLSRFRKLNDGEDDAELIARIKSCRPVREPEIAGRSGFAVGLSSFGSRPQAVAPLRASIPNAGGAQ